VNTHKFDTWVQVIHKKLWIAKVAHALTVALNWVIHALTVAGSRINGGASIYNLYSLYLNAPVVAQAQTVHKFQPAKTAGVSTPPAPLLGGWGRFATVVFQDRKPNIRSAQHQLQHCQSLKHPFIGMVQIQ